MTRLALLPLTTLRLIQRTFAAGLRAVSWLSLRENCGRMLTQVHSLHFLIHFISPKRSYRQISIGELLELCGFHRLANLEDAMRALQRLLKDYPQWAASSPPTGSNPTSEVCSNDIPALRVIPSKFWTLCQQILAFRQQRPTNPPVSIRRLQSWNLNSWHPDASTNAHKSGIIRSLLRAAPVLLQETKWTEVQLQHLSHGQIFKLPLPSPNKIHTHKQELQTHPSRISHKVLGALCCGSLCNFPSLPCVLVSVYLPPKVQRLLSVKFLKLCLPLRHTLSSLINIFFHEYGRRVGMVPRSSLKGGKNSLMVEKRTRTPNTTQTKQPKGRVSTIM